MKHLIPIFILLVILGVDTSTPFTVQDTTTIATSLNANAAETVTLTKVLADQKPTYADLASFRTLLLKTLTTKPTPKEIGQLMMGMFTGNTWVKYKSRQIILTSQAVVL